MWIETTRMLAPTASGRLTVGSSSAHARPLYAEGRNAVQMPAVQVADLPGGVERGPVEDEPVVGDLAVSDGDALGAGCALADLGAEQVQLLEYGGVGEGEQVQLAGGLQPELGPVWDRDDVTAFQWALGVVEPDRAGAVEHLPDGGRRGARRAGGRARAQPVKLGAHRGQRVTAAGRVGVPDGGVARLEHPRDTLPRLRPGYRRGCSSLTRRSP